MAVLVGYASKHGATQHIAERIAETLPRSGLDAQTQPIKAVTDVSDCEALVIGGALYFSSWVKDLTSFVKRNEATLAGRPVWLFSSGPLGTEPRDKEGHDLRVFFGALDHTTFGFLNACCRHFLRAASS